MLTRLARQGVTARSVIDVGANKGQFTIAACNILRPDLVHSFEPIPTVAHKLRQNCAAYPQVQVHELALGAVNGSAVININSHSQSSSLLPLGERHLRSFPRAKKAGEATVALQRLDCVIDPASFVAPVLMKVDAQGFEGPVLEGASGVLPAIDLVIAECSFSPLYEGETPFLSLLELLDRKGFELVRPVGHLSDPSNGAYLQMDGLFRRR
jgi:FkbM family methyltransferase